MFKPFFELLVEPLGLPIEWYYEYLILAIIELIAYSIAYKTVGDMYRCDLISGKCAGSLCHWLIRLFFVVIMWAVTYGVIWVVKLVKNNWQISLIISGGVIGAVILLKLIIIIVKKVKKTKS